MTVAADLERELASGVDVDRFLVGAQRDMWLEELDAVLDRIDDASMHARLWEYVRGKLQVG